jgi:RNA polymerase sigma factor (TIGR02999 family)
MAEAAEITRLLQAAGSGDRAAADRLFGRVYEELRRSAEAQRRRWRGDETLNTTALVHEAYIKLVGQGSTDWQDRAHFFAVAARAMRHVLVNYAERRQAAKRGGDVQMVPLDEANPVSQEVAGEVLALNQALERLEQRSERQSRVVECRFFVGLTISETADVLGISPATVKRDWALASAWLRREVESSIERGEAMG